MSEWAVKKSSWHYHVAKFWVNGDRWKIHNNLCGYCRQVIGGVFKLLFVIIAVLLLAVAATMPFWWSFTTIVYPVLAAFFALIDCAILVVLWGKYREYLREEGRLPEKMIRVRSKPPSLLAQWLRAKKSKICPLLTFVDENDEVAQS